MTHKSTLTAHATAGALMVAASGASTQEAVRIGASAACSTP